MPEVYRKRKYKKNFLNNVLLKIDYAPIFDVQKKDQIDNFHRDIKKIFPNKKSVRRVSMEGHIDHEDFQIDKKQTQLAWEFVNKDETKKMQIDQDFISLTYLKYKTFDKYFNEIKLVLDSFNRHFQFSMANRIGLRYVNIVSLETGNPFEWNNLINNNLFSVISNFVETKSDILKNMQFLEIKNEEYRLNFWYGINNPDHPNPISRKQFILDFDCYTTDETPYVECYEKIKSFNVIIDEWFEQSIEDGLREIMEEDPTDETE